MNLNVTDFQDSPSTNIPKTLPYSGEQTMNQKTFDSEQVPTPFNPLDPYNPAEPSNPTRKYPPQFRPF